MILEKSVSPSAVSEFDFKLLDAAWAEILEDDFFLFSDFSEQDESFLASDSGTGFEEFISNGSLDPLLSSGSLEVSDNISTPAFDGLTGSLDQMIGTDPFASQFIEAWDSFFQPPDGEDGELSNSFSSGPSTDPSPEINPANPAVSNQFAQTSSTFSWTFQGIANIVYAAIDPLTNAFTNVFNKTAQVIAEVASPRTAGGITESNPFSLAIGSVTQNLEGDFSIFSAIPFTGFLAQYWQLQYDSNTGQFLGQLVNPNTATALAANGLTVNEPLPGISYMTIPSYAAMQTGAGMMGFLTNQQMQIQIAGYASGLVASNFAFEITASLERTA